MLIHCTVSLLVLPDLGNYTANMPRDLWTQIINSWGADMVHIEFLRELGDTPLGDTRDFYQLVTAVDIVRMRGLHAEIPIILGRVIRDRLSAQIRQLFNKLPFDVYQKHIEPFIESDQTLVEGARMSAGASRCRVICSFDVQDRVPEMVCFDSGALWAQIRMQLAVRLERDPSQLEIRFLFGERVQDIDVAENGVFVNISEANHDGWQDLVNLWPKDSKLKRFIIEISREWEDEPEFAFIVETVGRLIKTEATRGSSKDDAAAQDEAHNDLLEFLKDQFRAPEPSLAKILEALHHEFG